MTKHTRCFHSLWPNTADHSCPTAGSDTSIYDFHET